MDNAKIPVVILAGGKGARFDHESQVVPKPMIKVAGAPIIKHIIDGFVRQGFREFIVLTGYMNEKFDAFFFHCGELIAPFLYRLGSHDETFTVRTVQTGHDTHTGERLWRARDVIGNRRFILTYGDGLSDVDMADVMARHTLSYREHFLLEESHPHPAMQDPLVTLTAVNPPGRFGALKFNPTYSSYVRGFYEKCPDDWINGGFMVCEPALFDFISGWIVDGGVTLSLEHDILPALADAWFLRAYRHLGYWRCMDTRRDRDEIEAEVFENDGNLPWMR